MQRISVRTLMLLVELYAAIITYQWIGWIHLSRPDAIWLAGNSVAVEHCPNPEPNCIMES